MSLTYLPEHAESARLALDLAEKEVAHLAYTHCTLFALSIDLQWVQALAKHEDLDVVSRIKQQASMLDTK